MDEVSRALRQELQERLAKAGVVVDEARLTNLSYAPEIAQAMLRRQQAEAVIAARQKIVHGAVSMVDMALKELAEKQVVELDDERKAAMVSNLMVVLCGESGGASGGQHRHPIQLTRCPTRKPFLLRIDPALWAELEAWAQGRIAQRQRPDRIPAQTGRRQTQSRRVADEQSHTGGRGKVKMCRGDKSHLSSPPAKTPGDVQLHIRSRLELIALAFPFKYVIVALLNALRRLPVEINLGAVRLGHQPF